MQSLLNVLIEVIAVVGFSSIVAHAFYRSNKEWEERMSFNLSSVEPEKIETPQIVEEVIEIPKVVEIIPEVIFPEPVLEPSPKLSVDFSKKTLKELVAICKADSKKYAGYTSIQKKGGKTGLATWMRKV